MSKDIHIVRVDHVCECCGFHNKTEAIMKSPVNVVSCGYCGEYIMTPQDFDPDSDAVYDVAYYEGDEI